MSSPYFANPYTARASILIMFDAMVPLSFGKSTKKKKKSLVLIKLIKRGIWKKNTTNYGLNIFNTINARTPG